MIKKALVILFFGIMLVTLSACSEAYTYENELIHETDNNSLVALADPITPERKILYEVKIAFDVTDLPAATAFLKAQLQTDEWFDREVLMSGSHSYIIRIKTERLDAFITTLQNEFTLRSYEKIGTDISLEYQDTSNRILSLEAQLARLLELYEVATMAELIVINEQMSDIEVELANLEGTLNQFDSLAEYSEVALVFYGGTVVTPSPFFTRLANAIVDGFTGLLDILDHALILLATLFPSLLVFGGIGILVWILVKKRKAKKHVDPIKPENK